MPGDDWRRPTERNDGCAVGPRVRNAGDEVGYARSRGRHAERRSVEEARVGEARHGRRLLMAHVNAAKPELHACLLHRHHGRAHDVEKVGHALVLHRFRDDI
jgi:hypothetical protein